MMRWIFVLMAAFTAWGAITKPAFFWEHRKARFMRGILGDAGAAALYIALALFFAWMGVFGPVK